MRRRRNASHALWPSLFALLLMLGASSAHAQTVIAGVQVVDASGAICSQYPGMFNRLVSCVQTVAISATQIYINGGVLFMVDTFRVIASFAVILFGILTLTGKTRAVSREAIILALKIGFVIFVMNQIATLFPFILQSMDYLIQAASLYIGGVVPDLCGFGGNLWLRLDCIMAHVLGVGLPGAVISMGLAGFLVASLFSGPLGVAIFFMGITVVALLVITFLHAMFIYLGSIIVLSLLMVLAPFLVPLVILKATKGYFEKWLRLVFVVILQPMFLFAYLAMFLLAANVAVFTGPYSLYRTVMCSTPNNNNTFGNHIVSNGIVAERSGRNSLYDTNIDQARAQVLCSNVTLDAGAPGPTITCEQSGAAVDQRDPNFGNSSYGVDKLNIDMPSVALNFEVMAANAQACVGPINNPQAVLTYMLRVMLSLLTAAAVLYVMYSLLEIIPFLGATIAGEAFSLSGISSIAGSILPKNSVLKGISNAQSGVKKTLGLGDT